MNCRHCATALHPREHLFIDLGSAPPSNAFLRPQDIDTVEAHWPLKAYTCPECRLVQLDEVQRREALFSPDYVYFSSVSSSWLQHARAYVDETCQRLALNTRSRVMEVASNDGYLLQYFQQRGIGCIGVEPTDCTAAVARQRGIDTIGEFFGLEFARRFATERGRVDLVVGNNVLAHVPDINDFVTGLREVLAPNGTLTLEFPHLMQLVQQSQFDTIYHEHFSYLSLHTVQRILAAQGLVIWDVQSLATHGGSLRVWAQHAGPGRASMPAVAQMLECERSAGMLGDDFYGGLQQRAEDIKHALLRFLLDCKRDRRRVAAYGAAAKGNTLLNFAGVRPDLLPYVVDASPHKQGRFLPGSRIPVVDESRLREHRPDFIVILPWNLHPEISAQLAYTRDWGASLVSVVPSLTFH